ncbi:MAG: ABC transporter transmembrane domain-containing protein, partial [Ktedonobacteraceae bacterium]
MLRLLRFFKPFRMTIVVVLVLAFAQTMANLYLPTLMANIVDQGIVNHDINYIWSTGGLMLLITIGGTICAIIGSFYSARVATGFGKILRAQIFHRVEQFSLHEFDTVSTASLITRTTNDTTQ